MTLNKIVLVAVVLIAAWSVYEKRFPGSRSAARGKPERLSDLREFFTYPVEVRYMLFLKVHPIHATRDCA